MQRRIFTTLLWVNSLLSNNKEGEEKMQQDYHPAAFSSSIWNFYLTPPYFA
jgi:hypothetical protein